jgi:transposase
MYFRYAEEQIEFLKKNANGRTSREITAMFNRRYGTALTEKQIIKAKERYGIRRGRLAPEQVQFILDNAEGKTLNEITSLFIAHCNRAISRDGIKHILVKHGRKYKSKNLTKEQVQFIKDNIRGSTVKDLTDYFNGHFNTSLTMKQIRSAALSRRLRFTEYPAGKETVNSQGVTRVKISDNEWKPKHILIWEQINGKVPKGQCIIFADKNRFNFAPDNLIMVSKNELLRLNESMLYCQDKELTKTGIAIVKLQNALYKKSEKLGNKELLATLYEEIKP